MHHCVPREALVQVLITDGTEGDLREMAREARKKYRKARRKYVRVKTKLKQLNGRAAPAFKAYAKKLLENHERTEPSSKVLIAADSIERIRKRFA